MGVKTLIGLKINNCIAIELRLKYIEIIYEKLRKWDSLNILRSHAN